MQIRLNNFRILTNYYLFLLLIIVIAGTTFPMRWSVTAYGMVEPVKKSLIKAQSEGVISEVLVQAGGSVSENQIIAKLRDPNIRVSQMANKADYEKAKNYLGYTKKMHKKGYVSDNELQEAELNYSVNLTKLTETKNYDILSPSSGTLLTTDEFDLRIGDNVEPGAIIATVADLSKMQIKVRVPEHNIARIKIGDEVRVYMNAFPSMLYKTIPGRVTVIQPQAIIDQTGNNFVVIISLDETLLKYHNRKFVLIPGMAGYAKIIYEKSSFFEHVIKASFEGFSKHV